MCRRVLRLSGLLLLSTFRSIHAQSRFKTNFSPLNEEFQSKDLSDLGLNVYLEEYDFIPREVSKSGRNREVCKISLKTNYQNDVYGLCAHFGCDITHVATRPYNKRISPLTTRTEGIVLPGRDQISEKERKACSLTKLAARCSSFLKFANCIYINYVDGFRTGQSHITLDRRASEVFANYPNNELVNRYLEVGGATLGFLFQEYLQAICSFVHSSCPSLHPQFKGPADYFWSQACVVFDFVTPLAGYTQFFYPGPQALEKLLISKELEVFSNYRSVPTDVLLSQLNIPLEYPYNTKDQLQAYKESVLLRRCEKLNYLYTLTRNLDLYMPPGKYRIYASCFQMEKYYGKCDLCRNMGIVNTIKTY